MVLITECHNFHKNSVFEQGIIDITEQIFTLCWNSNSRKHSQSPLASSRYVIYIKCGRKFNYVTLTNGVLAASIIMAGVLVTTQSYFNVIIILSYTEIHYEKTLPASQWVECKPKKFVTNHRYGHHYEAR